MPFPKTFNPSKFDDFVSNELNDITNFNKKQQLGNPGIKFLKGSFFHVDNLFKDLAFQFNPNRIKDSLKANWAEKNAIQSEQPIFQHLNFAGRSLSFELFLHGLEAPNGYSASVQAPSAGSYSGKLLKRAEEGLVAFAAKRVPYAEAIGTGTGILFNKFFPPKKEVHMQRTRDILADLEFLRDALHGQGNKPPPKLLFDWEHYYDSEWILTNYDADITMWDKNQIPLMATVSVVLREVKSPKAALRGF